MQKGIILVSSTTRKLQQQCFSQKKHLLNIARAIPIHGNRSYSASTEPLTTTTAKDVVEFMELSTREQMNHKLKTHMLRKHHKSLSQSQLSELCPFCNTNVVANGLITKSPNGNFVALYNIRPVFPGHSLIIPTSHITKFTDIPLEHVMEFYQFQNRIILALQKAYNTESFDMILQEGEFSGQSIPHIHIHLLPRVQGDLPIDEEWMDFFQKHEHTGKIFTTEEMQVEAQRIRQAYETIQC